ncbi:hypothetical protein ACVXHA_30070 [Escherichia coli]
MFEWGGISVDPNREVAIANPMALPFVSKLIPRGPGNPMEQPKDAKGTGNGIRHSATVRCTVWCHAEPVPLTVSSAV